MKYVEILPSLCICTENKIHEKSLWRFSHKASFLLIFLLCFFIPGVGDRGQQQSVGMDFFIIRLDHRCVRSTSAGITGARWGGGHARLWATLNFILPFQRCPLPVDHLCIFILLILFFILNICRQKLLEHVRTLPVSASFILQSSPALFCLFVCLGSWELWDGSRYLSSNKMRHLDHVETFFFFYQKLNEVGSSSGNKFSNS